MGPARGAQIPLGPPGPTVRWLTRAGARAPVVGLEATLDLGPVNPPKAFGLIMCR